jgi:hypothetical protein
MTKPVFIKVLGCWGLEYGHHWIRLDLVECLSSCFNSDGGEDLVIYYSSGTLITLDLKSEPEQRGRLFDLLETVEASRAIQVRRRTPVPEVSGED